MRFYCINLDRRPDRLSRMTVLAEHAGFSFKRISAFDGKAQDFSEFAIQMLRDGPTGYMSNSTLACTMSHLKSWETFVDEANSGDFAVFLEDDALFASSFCKTINAIEDNNMFGYGLIKLELSDAMAKGAFLGKRSPIDSEHYIRRSYQLLTGAVAYMLSWDLAINLLKMRNEISVPVDHFLFYPLKRKGFFGAPYGIIDPAISEVDLQINSDIASQRSIDSRLRRDIKRFFYEGAQAPMIISNLVKRKAVFQSIKFKD